MAPKAAVCAAPFTGYFLDHANFKHTAANYTSSTEYIYQMQNLSFETDGALSTACELVHAGQPGLCFMSPHMASIYLFIYLSVSVGRLGLIWSQALDLDIVPESQ